MDLFTFLHTYKEEILRHWEGGLPPSQKPVREDLRESLSLLLVAITGGTSSTLAREERARYGGDLARFLEGCASLRSAILDVWEQKRGAAPPLEQLREFLGRFDHAASEIALRYAGEEVRRATEERDEALAREQAKYQEARRALDELEAFFNAMPIGAVQVDGELRYIRANPIMAAINGRPAEEFLGRTIHEVLPPELASFLEVRLQKIFQTGEAVDDVEFLAPDLGTDQLHTWRNRFFPIRGRRGDLLGVGSFVEDITDVKQAADTQRYLLESSAILSETLEYETTLRKVAELVVPGLGDWCIFLLLKEGEGVFERAIIGHSDPERRRQAEELVRGFLLFPDSLSSINRIARTGESVLAHITSKEDLLALSRNSEHTEFFLRMGLASYMAVPVRARGRILGVLAIASTEPKRRYRQQDLTLAQNLADRAGYAVDNARLYREAQQAIHGREDILAFVSHDLRNPLTVILMGTTALKKKNLPAEVRQDIYRHADTIRRAAERMERLIHDLLDLASIQKGNFTVKQQEHDPTEIIREIRETFLPLAQRQNILLTIEVEPGLPCVRCDRDRVSQIFSNLIGNALQVTPAHGVVTLRAKRHKDQMLLFSISDTGPGIAEEMLPYLFERYWRNKDVGYRGTGLGLPIAKGIVEAHNGSIWVESRSGEGSTFFFTLPLS